MTKLIEVKEQQFTLGCRSYAQGQGALLPSQNVLCRTLSPGPQSKQHQEHSSFPRYLRLAKYLVRAGQNPSFRNLNRQEHRDSVSSAVQCSPSLSSSSERRLCSSRTALSRLFGKETAFDDLARKDENHITLIQGQASIRSEF